MVDLGDPDGGAVVRSIKHDAEHTRHPPATHRAESRDLKL